MTTNRQAFHTVIIPGRYESDIKQSLPVSGKTNKGYLFLRLCQSSTSPKAVSSIAKPGNTLVVYLQIISSRLASFRDFFEKKHMKVNGA